MSIEKEYIDGLVENLEKKVAFLCLILEKTKLQKEKLGESEFSEEEFHELADEKSTLLQGMSELDDEFNECYRQAENALKIDKALYRSEIMRMQELIKQINNKSVEIRALEIQNRASLELHFGNERKKIRQVKKSRQAAAGYYSAMSRVDTIEPQFMDKKK